MVWRWHYRSNNYVKYQTGDIVLQWVPNWVAVLDWFVDHVVGRGCCLLHWAKLPTFIHVTRDGERTSLQEYYGDFGSLYHSYVFCPIFYAMDGLKQKRIRTWVVPLGYGKIREMFGSDDPSLEPVFGDKEISS